MQSELFHEDINSALEHVINALGGPKSVGNELWPSLSVDNAGRKIKHCLNEDHAQNFHPNDIIWLLSEGRKKGIHSAMAWMNSECGYAEPQPIEPEEEQAKLMREFIAATEQLTKIQTAMGKVDQLKAVS